MWSGEKRWRLALALGHILRRKLSWWTGTESTPVLLLASCSHSKSFCCKQFRLQRHRRPTETWSRSPLTPRQIPAFKAIACTHWDRGDLTWRMIVACRRQWTTVKSSLSSWEDPVQRARQLNRSLDRISLSASYQIFPIFVSSVRSSSAQLFISSVRSSSVYPGPLHIRSAATF